MYKNYALKKKIERQCKKIMREMYSEFWLTQFDYIYKKRSLRIQQNIKTFSQYFYFLDPNRYIFILFKRNATSITFSE